MTHTSTTIVSWTLTSETAPPVREALESARDFVDGHLVIWTGAEPSPLGHIPDVVGDPGPGRRLVYRRSWAWANDFAAARNVALDLVTELGAAWGCMLDSDERVVCPDPAALRGYLAALPDHIDVALVHAADGSHTRERFFRLPARAKFVGRTHEMYGPLTTDRQVIVPRELVTWTELPKTREQLKAKFLRDVDMLRADLVSNPANGAAWYYIGVSLQSLALYAREDGDEEAARMKFEDAISCYRQHRTVDTSGAPAWHEGTAFSCYRAAECYLALGQPDRAIDCAVAGMVLDAGIAELPWIAAVASLQVGRLEQARCWALMAKAHGMGSAAEQRRRGFRVPHGLTRGPDEILGAVESISRQ